MRVIKHGTLAVAIMMLPLAPSVSAGSFCSGFSSTPSVVDSQTNNCNSWTSYTSLKTWSAPISYIGIGGSPIFHLSSLNVNATGQGGCFGTTVCAPIYEQATIETTSVGHFIRARVEHAQHDTTFGICVFGPIDQFENSTARTVCDDDQDGSPTDQDCNDEDDSIYPGAEEICGDGLDNNCNGATDELCTDEDPSTCTIDGAASPDDEKMGCQESPIILDFGSPGLALTDLAGGVTFDIDGDGSLERVAWTTAGSLDGFLALDRNGNGRIDGGHELFGNNTDQPPSAAPNGFLALAEFDRIANGGNGDGKITSDDAIFGLLTVWIDKDHNGESVSSELFSLPALRVREIRLDFRRIGRRDQYGNLLRFVSQFSVDDKRPHRTAIDVFFLGEEIP